MSWLGSAKLWASLYFGTARGSQKDPETWMLFRNDTVGENLKNDSTMDTYITLSEISVIKKL